MGGKGREQRRYWPPSIVKCDNLAWFVLENKVKMTQVEDSTPPCRSKEIHCLAQPSSH